MLLTNRSHPTVRHVTASNSPYTALALARLGIVVVTALFVATTPVASAWLAYVLLFGMAAVSLSQVTEASWVRAGQVAPVAVDAAAVLGVLWLYAPEPRFLFSLVLFVQLEAVLTLGLRGGLVTWGATTTGYAFTELSGEEAIMAAASWSPVLMRGAVALAVTVLAARLVQDVRTQQRRLETLISGADAVLWEADLDGRVRFVGGRADELLGIPGERWLGTALPWVQSAPEEQRPSLEILWHATVADGAPVRWQQRLTTPDGRTASLQGTARRAAEMDGGDAVVTGVFVDVTTLHDTHAELRLLNDELEARVEERTAALASANRDLEAFAYSVSHDLRAPLRAVDGFSRMLVEDHEDELSDDAQRVLDTIRSSTQRMGMLIDGLLRFSRAGRTALTVAELDMDALVQSVVEEQVHAHHDLEVEIEIEPLGAAHGDATLVRQVWANLIGNALKFTRGRPNPRIEISHAVIDGQTSYRISDNGVGFDQAYVGRLFGVFQRLHKAGEFDGEGVGLAIVQRIVQRHGGRVWADGRPGTGATFSFTLGGRDNT